MLVSGKLFFILALIPFTTIVILSYITRMGMLTLYTTKQRLGEYRCKSISVSLGDGSGMTVRRSNFSLHYIDYIAQLSYSAPNVRK